MGSDAAFYSALTAALEGAKIPFFDNPPQDYSNWLTTRAYAGVVAGVPSFDIHVPEPYFAAAAEIAKAIPKQTVVEDESFPIAPTPEEEREADPDYEPPMPKAMRAEFLAWFLPTAFYYGHYVWLLLQPAILKNGMFWLSIAGLNLIANLGFLWMLYQAARYERRPSKYILLAFVPFSFAWYWVRRYPRRPPRAFGPATNT